MERMSRSPYSLLSSISERLFSLFISDCHTTTATVSIKGKGSRALPSAADPSLSLLLSTCLYRRGPPIYPSKVRGKRERITHLKRRTLFPDLVGKRPFSKEVRASRNAAIEFALLVGKKRIPPPLLRPPSHHNNEPRKRETPPRRRRRRRRGSNEAPGKVTGREVG